MPQFIDTRALNDDARNAAAREAALQQVSWPQNLAPPTVSYTSHGHVAIVGPATDLQRAMQALTDNELASITLVTTQSALPHDSTHDLASVRDIACAHPHLEGYLGAFHLSAGDGGASLSQASLGRDHFDAILDLGTPALLQYELPPPGYHRVNHTTSLEQAVQDLQACVGEFEKPRYFQIDSDLCAHAGRGQSGCTRCLDICPADAISSVKQEIVIDPFRCHGAGSCTSACPTGAIRYALPTPERLDDYIARLLASYHAEGGDTAVVRFLDQETQASDPPPAAGHVLDVPLEELGAAGLDHWLGALARGGAEVRIVMHDSLPPSLSRLVHDQYAQATAMLAALGHDTRRLSLIDAGDSAKRDALPIVAPLGARLETTRPHAKREALNSILDFLAAHGTPSAKRVDMPVGAPFGTLDIDADHCTLCMACVAVCPVQALSTPGQSPALQFQESACVQCGLCEATCPEGVIALHPGFMADPETRSQVATVKEEAPFECISCGKPFATTSTIASIKQKLADHPYFAGDAIKRLEMCEDCRVKDIWHDMARDPNAQLKV
ncbi:4Fe-4S binding protein [Chromohalobacter marismortui]|uniref:4Fe-4S binding protein n=1 Tax=Chromohalobacter marismortui TaxID=42055 RepID=A0A4R7NQF0_9GAMM|nr:MULTISPECIES: 4Fe-4S dicluster domain-containing protein [Chromohalobacter]MCI0508904.1 4Fe-4S binding protein [Chromohalobacter sp.]MCI0594239.1 4Fe-4S binding protein [Chromohalobacter sp.]TDU22721.1 4Fe-4S binding protein [Chromohalobacter marismortui]